jgi:hypothetical protein
MSTVVANSRQPIDSGSQYVLSAIDEGDGTMRSMGVAYSDLNPVDQAAWTRVYAQRLIQQGMNMTPEEAAAYVVANWDSLPFFANDPNNPRPMTAV